MCVHEVYVSVLTDEYGVGGRHMTGALVCAMSKAYMEVGSVNIRWVCVVCMSESIYWHMLGCILLPRSQAFPASSF